MGGLQWQVQELRITSGNASIGMLLIATMGLVLPAALKIGHHHLVQQDEESKTTDLNDLLVSENDVAFSRFNSCVMTVGYISYLIFQLGSHKEEFDYDGDEYAVFGGGHNIVRTPSSKAKRKRTPTRQNLFCKRYCFFSKYCAKVSNDEHYNVVKLGSDDGEPICDVEGDGSVDGEEGFMIEAPQSLIQTIQRKKGNSSLESYNDNPEIFQERAAQSTLKSKCSDTLNDDTRTYIMDSLHEIIYYH